jgi:hypothetical protein
MVIAPRSRAGRAILRTYPTTLQSRRTQTEELLGAFYLALGSEIRPLPWSWKAFEAPGVEPVFPNKNQAIDSAQNRACFRSGEIRVLDSTGKGRLMILAVLRRNRSSPRVRGLAICTDDRFAA